MLDFLLCNQQSNCSPHIISIYYCLSTFQMSHSVLARLLPRRHCVAEIHLLRFFCILQVFNFNPLLQANPDVEDCHTKCFGEVSSPRKQFGLKTNCVCSKLGNAASQKSKCLLFISANTHISGSIWISTQLDFNNIRLLLASHMAPACN